MEDHLTDLDIILELDGELPPQRSCSVRRHLASCWTCRTQQQELSQGIADFTRLYQKRFDRHLPSGDQPRRLLQAHLSEASRAAARAPWWHFFLTKRILAGSAAALFVVLALRLALPLHSAGDVIRPNRELSPGFAALVSREQVCQMQNMDDAKLQSGLAQQVFTRYRIMRPAIGAYEVDYVIPPVLGGTQSVENLWPQPYSDGAWNSHTKDALEERLERLVCSGQIDVREAQAELANDWIGAYKKRFRSTSPLLDHVAFAKDRPWPFSTVD